MWNTNKLNSGLDIIINKTIYQNFWTLFSFFKYPIQVFSGLRNFERKIETNFSNTFLKMSKVLQVCYVEYSYIL